MATKKTTKKSAAKTSKKTPGKKTSAKTTSAKKTPAKKTSAKKTSAKTVPVRKVLARKTAGGRTATKAGSATSSADSTTTTDHDEIRGWAEARGGKPATVASTERGGEAGILRIEFPDNARANDSALEEISWDEFFAKFDESGLALLYQETTRDGEMSLFNKLVSRATASKSARTSTKKTSSSSRAR